jgi:hypothetical protein
MNHSLPTTRVLRMLPHFLYGKCMNYLEKYTFSVLHFNF